MAAFFFVAFIVLEVLVFTLLRLRLALIRSETSSGESSKGRRVAGKGVSRRADTQGIIEFTALLTFGIPLTCLMFGIFLLVPRPAASPIPMSDYPFYFLAITLIGVVLTFASYAITIVVAAILATVRTIAQFIE